MTEPVLSVKNLSIVYRLRDRALHGLDDVTLEVFEDEVVGIVGESGCGKTSLSLSIMQLLPPNAAVTAGHVVFMDKDLIHAHPEELRQLRGRDISMIFQDPLTSLNPTFSIGQQMRYLQRAHVRESKSVEMDRAKEALKSVGIADPGHRLRSYPHEFSGGMRQRVMIAMAMLLEPRLIIADEPTSALDVTLQAEVLELLDALRRRQKTSIMFVSHDLGVISQICDRVVVMYAGRVVESGSAEALFAGPLHPYTRALLNAVPSRKRRGVPLESIPGRVPGLDELPIGCKFAERCPYREPLCEQREPELVRLNEHGRAVRCHAWGFPRPEGASFARLVNVVKVGRGV
jgi:oligopeptide/dipeptide ABC transporter ATP-binding protein